MNWVLILVIAILAGYTLTGYAKGFLKIVYSLVSWIIILVVVTCATPHIENYLRNETNAYDKVLTYCEEAIRKQTQQDLEESNGDLETLLAENELYAAIAEQIPTELLAQLKNQTAEVTGELIESYGLYEKTAETMANLLIQGIATIIALIFGSVVSALLSLLFKFIGKLPIIGFANRILGLAAGAINGLIIVWTGFYLVTLLCATELGSNVLAQIYANEFLTYLYDNNLILSILN